jgi:cyclopropane-fatty-acyl-phospholipid synthase
METTTTDRSMSEPRPSARLLSRFVEWLSVTMLGRPGAGAVTVTFPNGRTRTIGDPATGPHGVVRLRNLSVIPETMKRGTVGFAAAYIRGDIEIDDLTALFRFFLRNRGHFERVNLGLFRKAAQDIGYHLSRGNTREGSRQNISEHYDLGNEFYRQWLDPTMTYSSALFASGAEALEDAQVNKYRRVADMAGIRTGDTVLEIGCGWGGFAETVARDYGAQVDGITLSREQLAFAEERLHRHGLDNLARVRFEDYRDTEGQYDHVASIEMIEAVGEEHWSGYFKAVHDRLKPGGTAVIQAITILERYFDRYRRGPDFIQRYIFPGGMLLTKTIMREMAGRAGLVLESVEHFRHSYAKTLRLWRDRFLERWPQIAPLGFDEAFKRKWAYYLAYCEAGFEEGAIDVGIYQYRRPG